MLLCHTIVSRCSCCDNKKHCNLNPLTVGSYLITTSGRSFDCINHQKVSLRFPMEYVEYASREGFVLLRDGKILWAHLVRFHPMLQHVTRSRGWNITERVNGNVDNEIELGMVIPTFKSRILQVSQKQRE
jgi:hypothetical protein